MRQREDSERLLSELGLAGKPPGKALGGKAAASGGAPPSVASAVLGPAAALILEVPVDIATDAAGWPPNLAPLEETSLGGRLASFGRGVVSFGRRGRTESRAATRRGKLFVFRDRVLLARCF